MKNYVEFKNGEQSFRAYTTLANLFKIEEDLNISLNSVYQNGVGQNMDKIKTFYLILSKALETDFDNKRLTKEERVKFLEEYFAQSPYLACLIVYRFVGQSMEIPKDDGVPNSSDESKKKKTDSPMTNGQDSVTES